MITVIRNKIIGNNSYFVWVCVVVIIISLGAPSFVRQGSSSGPWVIIVNGQEIGYNQFVRMVTWQEQAMRQKEGSSSSVNTKDVYRQSIDTLLYRTLLDQAAIQAGISVSPCYSIKRISDLQFILPILIEMNALEAFHFRAGIDMRSLRKSLHDKGLTLQDFQEEVSKTIGRELIQQAVFIAGYSPKFEQTNSYKNKYLGKTFTVVTFPLAKYITLEKESGSTKKELQEFFDLHARNYTQPEKRSGVLWEFSPSTFGSKIKEELVEDYYEKHKDTQFTESPVKLRVRRILLAKDALAKAKSLQAELKENSSLFEEKARSLSLDEKSAKNGGLLEPFARGVHEKEFDKAAFLLPTNNAVSEVIMTKDGLEIIQLIERINKVYKPLKAVQKEIYTLLERKQFRDLFENEIRPILRTQDVKTLDAFVVKHQGISLPYTQITRQSDNKLAQRLFSMKKNEITSFYDQDKECILLATDIIPSYVPKLNTIESQVMADLLQAKAVKKLSSSLQEVKKKASTGNMSAISQEYNAPLTRIDALKAIDTQSVIAHKNKGLDIDKMLLLEKPGSLLTLQDERAGYLVKLDSIENMSEKDIPSKESAALHQERMQTTLFGFIASMRRNATIKQSDTLINFPG